MTLKRHAFSIALMVNEAKEDAVDSDYIIIDRMKSLPKEERIKTLSETFNLSKKLTLKIVENDLYIALLEAATLINTNAETFEEITTLRHATNRVVDHYLIKKMVEKYEVMIALFALQMSPFAQKEILDELQTSRRSANTIKTIFQPQITKYREELAIKHAHRNSAISASSKTAIKQYAVEQKLNEIPSIYENVTHGKWFNNLRVLIEIAEQCQLNINKINKKTIDEVFQKTKFIEEGRAHVSIK